MTGAARLSPARLPYAHLDALTDELGLFEHAQLDAPRREHGYCVDDAARALLVVAQEPEQSHRTRRLTEQYLRFLEGAVEADGTVHNRMSPEGEWTDDSGVGDWWGRSVWAAGVVAASAELPLTRRRAMKLFLHLAEQRSPHLRSVAFAALGAAEVMAVRPHSASAAQLLRDAAPALLGGSDPAWPWPEPRLRYANGCLPEALLAAGEALEDPVLLERGVETLAFLLEIESLDGHLSVTGWSGRDPDERGSPLFDQQPIEVAAIAAACARALTLEEDPLWREGLASCWAWFHGVNDSGTAMVDLATGAGFDGLERDGRNENRGAESTIAALHTSLVVRRAALMPTRAGDRLATLTSIAAVSG
ncbi:glycosyltransferase [Rathayibacter sp. VKM Ac-2754]|uniref:glycosyltransferase n=1 Tax=Rathayibacter sp. VKM Ac-2754 TaxID=2609251 RepID=UPI0013568F63|nr:glycosyltransferase [Rathayibacter sp. VKM Ac-2754]MWV58916.1 glycosyltransferase [Rathayibacter sp. VKM Ac-2754]